MAEWLRQRERSNPWALRTIAGICRRWGRRPPALLLHPISFYFCLFAPRANAAVSDYLLRVLGRPARLADRFRLFHRFAETLLDRVLMVNDRRQQLSWSLEGEEHLRQVLAEGRGCLLLGAHFGSFDLLRAVGKAKGSDFRMLMYPHNARMVQQLMETLDPTLTGQVIELGPPHSLLAVKEALEQGLSVGVLADRAPADQRTLICEFLGAPARFPRGPLTLALALRAPVVLFFGINLGGGRYRLCFEPFEVPSALPRCEREAWLQGAVQDYANRLARRVREAPDNWFNFYPFWG
ncbi:lipid A biosynthesis acyltransferase [Aestuariirhabdus litorea]|uniref:Lipid A biosynthesis acyltransferase n=1 Tax=Aestuariirhabdus litorea TaxID=2528527 RepID=A0A3P3VR81_9GAMM|nr:lipid A biosynthesis acyltransferase [Aestuariirhabdus litorea]RRJ85235.1 lipid A biosynthesis acyltransferase [Aestuariirhabdus litorea]RWW98456.1 lipid A biosynthesis acyltransferase [Endozoicomonadaceae bacterium GTF-13]